MANVNVACNPVLVVVRATDVAGLRGIGGGTHTIWGDLFIDRSQPYNILSLHQSQVHGFRELTSQDQQRYSPERGIVLVFHKDDTDKFFIRKVYSIGLMQMCIVRTEFITQLIFTPLISSSEPRRSILYSKSSLPEIGLHIKSLTYFFTVNFIRHLIIHLTKCCQPCLCHHLL